MVDLGWLVVRMIVGLTVAAHGAQKLFGWFGGPGLRGTAGWLGMLGLRPSLAWAFLAGVAEFGGGLGLALGALWPLGPIGVMAAMTTAILLAHWPRFWASNGGMELPLTNGLIALGVALAGPGAVSVDGALRISTPAPVVVTVAVAAVAGVLGASLLAARGRRQPPLASVESTAEPQAA